MDEHDRIEAVRRMQRHIDAHLLETITLGDLARAAAYSPWHAARMFAEYAGCPPLEYVRRRRLSQAALKLRDHPGKIVDVAFDFVFGSHEGFTKAFSKEFGIAPKRYAATTPPIGLFLPSPVQAYRSPSTEGATNMKEKETAFIFVQVVDRPKRKVLLRRGIKAEEYFEYCDEVGCDVWGVLASVREALYEPVGMWLPEALRRPGTSTYVQGVELPLDYDKPIPAGYELVVFEPCRLMVFQGEPYDDAFFMEAIGAVMERIDKFDPAPYGYAWDDAAAPRIQLEPQGARGYIEARPVRPLGRE